MRKRITVFDGLTKYVDVGLQHMNLLIFFVVGGKKQPALEGYTRVAGKLEAVQYAGHWLEEVGGELCTAAEKALQYRKPSREVLVLLDKMLPMGASMLTLPNNASP